MASFGMKMFNEGIRRTSAQFMKVSVEELPISEPTDEEMDAFISLANDYLELAERGE